MQPFALTRANRIRLAQAFRQITKVDLGIDCVVEDQMGSALVDDPRNPSVYQIVISIFHYLAGNPQSPGAIEMIKAFPPGHLLMAAGEGFFGQFKSVFAEKVVEIPRFRYDASSLSIEKLTQFLVNSPHQEVIKPLDLYMAESFYPYPEGLLDLTAYDSPEDVVQRGIGFVSIDQDTFTGACYASLVCSRGIEISLYVHPGYRRQGLATALSARLLLWCLKHKMEPHWDAANAESCALAEKLGYTFLGEYCAYTWLETD